MIRPCIGHRAGSLLAVAGFFVMATTAGASAQAASDRWRPPPLPAPTHVALEAPANPKGPLTALVYRPAATGDRPLPVVVGLHGCGGLLSRAGLLQHREHDWTARWLAAGYAVVLPDSFNPRGYRQICTAAERRIGPSDRAHDVAATTRWIAEQRDLDPARIALVGWSHGAMTTLWAVRQDALPGPARPKLAIAFYPGCREIAKLPGWKPTIPLTVLSGARDDWTNPAPCRELSRSTGFRMVEYPGAYHGFDAPDTPLRVRTGITSLKAGTAHVGTDPAARVAAIEEVTRMLGDAFGRR